MRLHGRVLIHRVLSSMTLPAVIVLGVIALVAIKELALLGLLDARFRQRSRRWRS